MKVGLSLMKNAHTLLAKSVLVPIGLTAAASAVDAGIHKKKIRIWSPWFQNSNMNNIKRKNERH